jgi:hypothetical protein
VSNFTDADNTIKREKADSLSHLIGSKDEELRLLPDLSNGFEKDARRNFSEMEKMALIEEDGAATNTKKLDIKGTHYENQSASEIALTILPMLGL